MTKVIIKTQLGTFLAWEKIKNKNLEYSVQI